jgi:membrane protease YdiL (CAAX protease family)
MFLQNYFNTAPKHLFLSKIGQQLLTNKIAKAIEILILFLSAFLIIRIFISNDPKDLIYNQAIIWIANIIMLTIVFIGIKLRGEGLLHFGFDFKKITLKEGFKMFIQSIIVFILVLAAFVIGSIIMANITGIPEASSDMSGYNYLKDNLGMLVLTLFGVYIVSSFGEEVIYRAFLINRISELGLTNKSGRIFVLVISALVFGLVHYSWGLIGIVQTGFMGLALGISYLYLKKRIWVLILTHIYMDTILMLQLYFN